jgi:hypothetical protein
MSSRLWALFIHFIREILTTYHYSLLRWANLNKEIRKMLTGIIYFFVDFILTFLMSFIFDILVCAAYEKAIARKNLLNYFFSFSPFCCVFVLFFAWWTERGTKLTRAKILRANQIWRYYHYYYYYYHYLRAIFWIY